MSAFPSLTIEGVTISRVICGTNALLGYSHVSAGRDAWAREYFTAQRIARVFARCQELGVNAVMGPLHSRLAEALDETARLTGQAMVWVATTAADRAPAGQLDALQAARAAGRVDEATAISRASLADQAAELKALGAAFCLLHGAWADRWPEERGGLVGCADAMATIRAAGLVPGSSSHDAPRVSQLDDDAYGTAVLAAPVNRDGWFMRPSQADAMERYARLRHPLIAIKTLACGKFEPEMDVAGNLRWAAAAPGVEAVALGVMIEQEAEQGLPILREAFAERYG